MSARLTFIINQGLLTGTAAGHSIQMRVASGGGGDSGGVLK